MEYGVLCILRRVLRTEQLKPATVTIRISTSAHLYKLVVVLATTYAGHCWRVAAASIKSIRLLYYP
jgi:hypothetical protein